MNKVQDLHSNQGFRFFTPEWQGNIKITVTKIVKQKIEVVVQ